MSKLSLVVSPSRSIEEKAFEILIDARLLSRKGMWACNTYEFSFVDQRKVHCVWKRARENVFNGFVREGR